MFKRVVLFILIAFVAASALGQNAISSIPLSKKISVLNGRAYFNFPATAYNLQRSGGGMSASPNINEETRIIYDTGKMRIVFFIQELYLLGDRTLLNQVNNDNAYKKNFVSKELIATDSLYAILSSPVKHDSLQRAIMINSLLVQTADGTLFRVDAYIDSNAYAQKQQFKALSENIFKTATNGPRFNARAQRMETYTLSDSSLSFRFRLPANYYITIDKLYDFEIFKVHKYRSFTDTAWADITINVGERQNYTYQNYGLYKQDAIIDSSGMLFGKPVKWMTYLDNWHGIYLKEEEISSDNFIEPHLAVHVSMVTHGQDNLFELSQLVESIDLRQK